MILILASRWDTTPNDIAAAWADQPVSIMTARDLSRAGWCLSLGAHDDGVSRDAVRNDAAVRRDRAVIEGQPIADEELQCVLTRLPWVTEMELPEIVAPDRAYVAAEMSAFLLFWLSGLACPVLNKPTPTCLAGPGWRPERWTRAAAETGMTVRAVQRDSRLRGAPADCAPSRQVTVVGSQVFGEVHPDLKERVRLLAELAHVSLLTVQFCGAERGAAFLGADASPSLDDQSVRAAVLEHLTSASSFRK
jgi:hypothetical protein